MADGDHSFELALIVKDDEGRANLYRLLTEGRREEGAASVEVSRAQLEQYRGGLLTGAVWDGDIMRAAIRGEDEETLAGMLESWDFVELNPMETDEMSTVDLPETDRIRKAALRAGTICVRRPEDLKDLCVPVPVTDQAIVPYIFSDGGDRIRSLCGKALSERFPEGAPPAVKERMEKELEIICNNGYTDQFLLAGEVADYVRRRGYLPASAGENGASFVAYILGITDINPLIPHGADDGYTLPWEMVFDISGARSPSISIQVPCALQDDIFRELKSRHGNVFYVKRPDWKDKNTDYIVVLPEGTDANRYTPLQTAGKMGMDDALASPFDFICLDQLLMVQAVIPNPLLDDLHELERLTGVPSGEIRMDDARVPEFFRQKREDENAEFNRILSLIGDAAPNTFRELADILGRSMASWRLESPETMRYFSCREDILRDMISYGLSKEKAYTIMTRVRKGRGLGEELEEWVKEAEVPDGYVQAMKNLDYLYPRGHILELAGIAWRIAYYRVCGNTDPDR